MRNANPFYFYLNPILLKKFIFIFFIICSEKLCAFNAVGNECVKINQVVPQWLEGLTKSFAQNGDKIVVLPQAQNDGEVITVSQAELIEALSLNKSERPNPLWTLHKKNKNAGRKVLGAVLAFPLPFGVIGLHRIYLGTKPYVPLIYIGSLGGGFGILPFIDFWVILLDKDIDRYKENSHVFMWIENQEKKPEKTNSYD